MLLLLITALADEPNVVYKKRTEIDFEAAEIEGQIKKPHGAITMERVKANFSPLVHLRENFIYEMNDSINQIQ